MEAYKNLLPDLTLQRAFVFTTLPVFPLITRCMTLRGWRAGDDDRWLAVNTDHPSPCSFSAAALSPSALRSSTAESRFIPSLFYCVATDCRCPAAVKRRPPPPLLRLTRPAPADTCRPLPRRLRRRESLTRRLVSSRLSSMRRWRRGGGMGPPGRGSVSVLPVLGYGHSCRDETGWYGSSNPAGQTGLIGGYFSVRSFG